jgi:hypothetical protein
MYRSLYPFILASIGFTAFILVTSMPLFEWQISDIATDFPSTYEVVVSPSPWMARLGDSLNDGSYVFGEVSISMDGKGCLKEDLTFIVRRSAQDKSFDQIWLNIYKNISWLSGWSWVEVILSSIYILWFLLWSKQGRILHAIILTGIAVILFLNLTQILRLVAPFPFPHYFGTVHCYHGTVTFNAELSKIHYETPIILLVGILLECGAVVIMLRQITKAIIERKKTSA